MSGRRNTWWARGAVLLAVLLFLNWGGPIGAGPTRAPGLDIAVIDITSHNDGQKISLTDQSVSALLSNEGTLDFSPEVNATLTVYYPADQLNMTVFFTETINQNQDLEAFGSSKTVLFTDWLPSEEGLYAINVSVDAIDDHPGNNSANITVEAVTGDPVGLTIQIAQDDQVVNPGESVIYAFRIRNDGLGPDNFTLDIDSGWLVGASPDYTGPIQPGEWSSTYVLTIKAPSDGKPGIDIDILSIKATSQNDPLVFKQDSRETKIGGGSGVLVRLISEDWQVAYPGGDWVEFTFLVTNTGNYTDTFELEVIARPDNWIAELYQTSAIQLNVKPLHSREVRVRVRIPPLNYETMALDKSLEGDSDAVVLRATSPFYKAVASAEGHVRVGLVHTVDIKVNPPNATISWLPDSPQNVSFSLGVRSINNKREGKGVEMDVNLSLPEGPYGVLFYPLWDMSKANESESDRWLGAVAPKILHLESGETSFGSKVEITAPPFPFQGTAVAVVEAVPQLEEGVEGLPLEARELVKVFVQPELDFQLEPPKTDYYEEYMNGSIPVDADSNGVPDWQEGAPGDKLLLPFNLTNIGNAADVYDIYADAIPNQPSITTPKDWEVKFDALTDELTPFWFDPLGTSHSQLVWVEVTIPDGTPIGESANIKMDATSILSGDERYSDTLIVRNASIDIFVIQGFGLDLEPEESAQSAEPDETVEYRLNISNTGNGVDRVQFIPMIDDLQGWEVEFNVSDLDLSPRQKKTITLFVTPSVMSSVDDMLAIKIRAQSLLNPSTYDEVWVNTTVLYVGGVSVDLLSESPLIWRQPGEVASFKLQIWNTGNGEDTFQIELELGAQNWAGVVDAGTQVGSTISVDLLRGDSRTFYVNISLPALVQASNYQELKDLMIIAQMKIASYLTVYPRTDPDEEVTRELTVGVLQQYKADLTLAPLEASHRKVLVGESANYRFLIKNAGNGDDTLMTVQSSPAGSLRHLSWSDLDTGPFSLTPFQDRVINLTLTPLSGDLPAYGERIDITIEAIAGNGVTYRKINVSAEIVLSRLLTDLAKIDLGTEGEVKVRLSNLPAPGSSPRPGFPDQKSFIVESIIDLESASGTGWSLPMESFEVDMIELYQLGDVSIPVVAPPDLISNSQFATVRITIRGPSEMYNSHTASAMGVYFDAAIDVLSTKFQNLYEGRTGKAYIRMVATGNRGQDVIPITVKVGGEVIGEYNAGPASPQEFGTQEQEIIFTVEFDLPTLKWYEKGKRLDLEVIIDPDNDIVENTPSGRELSETNNVLKKEFIIKNYTPGVPALILLGLILLFAAVAGVIGFFYLDRKNSWFLLPLSIGLTGLFAMLFYVPLEERDSYLSTANGFGLMIILVDILFIIPVMLYLYTRSGDSYILHLINERRGREIVEGQEVSSSVLKPMLISLIGGVFIILIPVLLWVVPSEINRGASGLFEAMFGLNGTLPVVLIVLIIPAIAVGVQFLLLQLKRGSLKEIEKTWDSLERLKEEIKEGLG
ncbi:MAG: hypothetical protein ACMUHB_06160 [Thermoplasmatota archaeon]